MNIEEVAFKDRRELANLNEIDLLDIIEFLQVDRRQWIREFNKTFNENMNTQQENQKLKKQLENCYCNRTDCVGRIKDSKAYTSLEQKVETQQNEFIEYLEDEINIIENKIPTLPVISSERNYLVYMGNKLLEILQKYRSIIGDVKNGN